MRLGRVPLLGIDYGSPSSFSSSEARQYAREGNYKHAELAEMLCDLYKDRPDESDGLFRSWDLQVGMLASRFGASREDAMELIRAECDPDYTRNEFVEPEFYEPLPQETQAYQNLQAKGLTTDSMYSWNKGTPVATQGRRPTIPTIPYGSLFDQGMTAAPVSIAPLPSYGNYAGT